MLDYIPSFVRWARFPVIVIIMCALAGCAGVASRHTTHPYTPVSVNPDMRRDVVIMALAQLGTRYRYGGATPATRSAERRVGKEGVSKRRTRGSPYHSKQKKATQTIGQ